MAQSSNSKWLIAAYLLAAVAANLIVFIFGPTVLPITAFFLIPFDLCARDALQERWKGNNLRQRMIALILAGSILTAIINVGAYRIALASFTAFAIAGCIDWLVYTLMSRRHRLAKMNGSNVASSIADSIIFPAIAFGIFSVSLSASQAASKIIGGVVWSFIIHRWEMRKCQRQAARDESSSAQAIAFTATNRNAGTCTDTITSHTSQRERPGSTTSGG